MKNDVLIYHEVEKEGCPKRAGDYVVKVTFRRQDSDPAPIITRMMYFDTDNKIWHGNVRHYIEGVGDEGVIQFCHINGLQRFDKNLRPYVEVVIAWAEIPGELYGISMYDDKVEMEF